MAHEYKFFRAAVRESNCPDGARGVNDLAEIRIMGAIAEAPGAMDSRESYIEAGMDYLDSFDDIASMAIEMLRDEIKGTDPEDVGRIERCQEIIDCINDYISDAEDFDREEFRRLLAEDWDKNYQPE